MNEGLLILRLVLGLGLAAHGAQKLFGWFGGHGLDGTGGFFEGLGFRPGRSFAIRAGLGEVGGGLLVTVGLFGPVGPAIVVLVMLVAALTVHVENGFFAMNDGIELPLLYAAGATALAFTGPGAWSFDAGLGLEGLWRTTSALLVLTGAVLIAVGTVALRRPVAAAEAGLEEAIEAS